MKIVTVLHDFRGGGAEKVAVLLANEWRAQGFESEIICISEDGPFRARVDANVPVVCLRRAHAYAAIASLAVILRNNRDAVVVSHLTHMNVVCLLACLISGHRRIFVVEHNDFGRTMGDVRSVVTRLGFLVAPLLYNFAQSVICVSQSVLDSLPALLMNKHQRSCVVANPIDPSGFADHLAEGELHPWFAEEAPVLLACGRLTRQKNYDMMLHALRDVLRRKPAKLIVLGEGAERERLEALAVSLGISASVDFVGFHKNPAAFFAKARLFVSTSAWEGLPMTMIEALFAGANLVVSNSCSDAPKLTNGGRFGACVLSNDPQAFASAVIDELNKPIASVADKREYLADFMLPKIAAQYVAVFERSAGALDMRPVQAQ